MSLALQQFAEAVQRPDDRVDLEGAALLLGAIANDGAVDLARCKAQLDDIAELARKTCAQLEPGPWACARGLGAALFGELGFRGNSSDYYDPGNSFLHRVLERRLGIPISLSVLYLEIARRLGLRAFGVGFPGHFIVRADSDAGSLFVDPFHGGITLDDAGLTALLARRAGAGAKVEREMLQPISNKALLTRMLFNLAGIYGQRNDWARSLAVLERLALLDPDNPRIARELVDLRARMRTLN